jgi:hypothetical protein
MSEGRLVTLYRSWSQKGLSVTEFSSVNGTERATAHLARCRSFKADARDKFFVNVRRTSVSCVSQSKHLIRGLRFYPGSAILPKSVLQHFDRCHFVVFYRNTVIY